MRRVLALLCVLLPLSAARADALSVRDIIELTKAGAGEEVLLALIEVDRGIYPIDVATIKELKRAGVTDAVISAMIRKGRTPAVPEEPVPVSQPEPAMQAPPPTVVVIEHHDVEQVAVPVAVPVFFPTGRRLRAHTFNAQTQQITSGAPIVPTGAPIVPTGAPILLMGTPRLCTAMDCR